jgi:pimeloyl-ACP methyl ester carboxylesterase
MSAALSQAAGAAAATLPLQPCQLAQAQRLLSVAAECGELTVPEDRALPGGRQIRLFVARVPAISRQHRPDPLFLLAGGPGLGASDFYPNVAGAFARIHRDRDIILVDQRGTGRSNPLFDDNALWEAGEAEVARAMANCQQQLSQRNDLRQFTTSVAVADLEAVRQALGYAQVNLYGSSYGTRVAQHYARRYPQQTRALILDGIVPPQRALGPATPLDAQQALRQILARCRADTRCHARFGDPQQDYQGLQEQLLKKPVAVTLPDPRSGKPTTLQFSHAAFATALRLASYSAEQAALLPLSLHLAYREGNFLPLASQFLMATTTYGELLSYGMHNSVVCAEDVPFFGDGYRPALEGTFLGTAQVDALLGLCKAWPRGPVDADLHAPLRSEVPALLLSGTADPVTPARDGALAAQGFRYALHLQVTDQGHGQLGMPCMDRVMADFLARAEQPATVPTLPHACVDGIRPPPFFLTLAGPAP